MNLKISINNASLLISFTLVIITSSPASQAGSADPELISELHSSKTYSLYTPRTSSSQILSNDTHLKTNPELDIGVTNHTSELSLAQGLRSPVGSSKSLLPASYPRGPGLALRDRGRQSDSSDEEDDMAAIGEAMANPLSYLWLMFTQNDTISHSGDVLDALGEDDIVNNTFIIQPVLSVQLTEKWKTVLRPVIPINTFDTVDNVDLTTGGVFAPTGVNLKSETGLGDIVLWAAFSKQYTPPNIFGFGVTSMWDTASEDQLGTGKHSAGPMALAFKITPKWVLGVVAQHFWSFSGDDTITINTSAGPAVLDRPDVNLTDIQPVVRYRVSPITNIGAAPNWRYNHESDQASIPLGIGGDTLVKMGKLPVKIGAEFYYYVEQDDDYGPDWQVRLLFIPVLPAPAWSRKPIF